MGSSSYPDGRSGQSFHRVAIDNYHHGGLSPRSVSNPETSLWHLEKIIQNILMIGIYLDIAVSHIEMRNN